MNPLHNKINRRRFLGVAGSSCAVLSAIGIAQQNSLAQPNSSQDEIMPLEKKQPSKSAVEGKMQQVDTDVLIVGGGMAGVFAAVKAHDNGAKVVLVDKGAVGKSGQTPFARGIFRYDEEKTGMSKKEYLAQTARVSEYMNNPVYTSLMLDESGACIDELDSWGFFDEACYAKSLNRPLKKRNIPIYERVMLTHLLTSQGRASGAMGLFIDKNETLVIHAKSVILCTGASGFKPTGWQIGSLTSDGDAMAYRIGAQISGKEWNDGHPMTNPGLEGLNKIVSHSNISPMLGVETNIEVSQNGPVTSMGRPPRAGGQEGMGGHAPGGEHPMGPPPGGSGGPGGPGGPPSGNHEEGEHHGPPGGGNMTGGCSAGMAIHKAEGLFPVNGKCASNIAGLYAAGDSLASMQNGGIYTQVGSSLAGSAAQGALAGKTAAEFSSKISLGKVSADTLKKINTEIYAPLLRVRGFSPQWVTQTLQGVMIPNFILYVKSEERLKAALTYIEYLRDHQVPLLMANDLHELRQAHETANMILNAEMKLRASLMRTESRGSHYREDYPERNDKDWVAWIKIYKGSDGNMTLAKHML